MKVTTYRDREGAMHFNLTINEMELTAIDVSLACYISEAGTNDQYRETVEYLAKEIESIEPKTTNKC